MDKRFLHKVLDQIMSETTIDYDNKRVYTPFSSPLSSYSHVLFLYSQPPYFYSSRQFLSSVGMFPNHCKEVYGLNYEEIFYVWDQFRQIIKDMVNNG